MSWKIGVATLLMTFSWRITRNTKIEKINTQSDYSYHLNYNNLFLYKSTKMVNIYKNKTRKNKEKQGFFICSQKKSENKNFDFVVVGAVTLNVPW